MSWSRNPPRVQFSPRFSCLGCLHPRRFPLLPPHTKTIRKMGERCSACGHGAQELSGCGSAAAVPGAAPVPAGTHGCGSSPVAVVVEMVVTGQSKEDTESRAQGEEYLRSSINPNLPGEATGRLENEQGRGSLGLGWGWEMPHGVPIPWCAHPMAQGWGLCWHMLPNLLSCLPRPPRRCPGSRGAAMGQRELVSTLGCCRSRTKQWRLCLPVPGGGTKSRGAPRPQCPLLPAELRHRQRGPHYL